MPSATIKLFLVHGDAKRLRTAEIMNWTGFAIAGPRSELDGVLRRDQAAKSGVYLLTPIAKPPPMAVRSNEAMP
jgi:hypothetical protein